MKFTYSIAEGQQPALCGINLTLMNPELIRNLSRVEVTSSKLNHDNKPVNEGVNSTLMGVTDARFRCKTCGQGLYENCVGHNGHMEFPVPVYQVGYKDVILRLLRHTCYWCSTLLVSKTNTRAQVIANAPVTNMKRLNELTPPSKTYSSCHACGCGQPKYENAGLKLNAVWSDQAIETTLLAKSEITAYDLLVFVRPFTTADAHRIVSQIPKADLEFLGLKPEESHPCWALMVNMVVPPPVIRPGITHHDGSKASGQNDMTQRLRDILRKKEKLQQAIQKRIQEGHAVPYYLFTEEQRAQILSQSSFGGISQEDLFQEFKELAEGSLTDEEILRMTEYLKQCSKPVVKDRKSVKHAMKSTKLVSEDNQPRLLPQTNQREVPKRSGETLDLRPMFMYGRPTAKALELLEIIQEIRENNPAGNDKKKKKRSGFPITKKLLEEQELVTFEETDQGIGFHFGLGSLVDGLQEQVSDYIKPDSRNLDKGPKSLTQRLRGKEGRFRHNLTGKRVNFCARTVISVTPEAEIDEVFIPKETALGLYYPETVNEFNLERLQARVYAGPGVLHGAHSVITKEKSGWIQIYLEFFKGNRQDIQLKLGDKVERYLEEGDLVLFNRHPSLHKFSIMAHRIRLHSHGTFAFNVMCCPPYNADFDGDEMNIHVLQNEVARAEAQELMSINKNLLSAKNNSPTLGMVMDAVVLAYLFTLKDTFLPAKVAFQLTMAVKHYDHPLPPPAILKPQRLWTGKQLVSWLLPKMSYQRLVRGLEVDRPDDTLERSILILEGELLYGSLCAQTLGRAHQGIIHIMNLEFPGHVAKFMADLQRMLLHWCRYRGVSIGMDDLIVSEEIRGKVRDYTEESLSAVSEFQERARDLLSLNETEMHEINLLAPVMEKTRRLLAEINPRKNAMASIIYSGAKGSKLTMTQITCLVGPQYLRGQRFLPENHRVLPCEPQNGDFSPQGRGFVDTSYLQGLNAKQFFRATCTARDSMVDVGVRTSVIGYMGRTLQRNCEGKILRADGTVRDPANRIVQYAYAGDVLDGSYLEKIRFKRLEDPTFEICPEVRDSNCQSIRERYLQFFERDFRMITDMVGREPQASWLFTSAVHCEMIRWRLEATYLQRKPDEVISLVDAWKMQLDLLSDLREMIKASKGTILITEMNIREHLSPHRLVLLRLSEQDVRNLFDSIRRRMIKAVCPSGEAVGPLAAENITEPAMQMTLNTFHFSGTRRKTVSQGLPRLRELIRCSAIIQTPSCHIPVNPPTELTVPEQEEFINRSVMQAYKSVRLRDIVSYATETGVPDPSQVECQQAIMEVASTISEVQDISEAHALLGEVCYLILLCKRKIHAAGLRIPQVLQCLSRCASGGVRLVVYHKKKHLDEDVMAVRLYIVNLEIACRGMRIHSKKAKSDEGSSYLLGELIDRVSLKGLPSITDCTLSRQMIYQVEDQKITRQQQWVIETSGSDLYSILIQPMPHVDKTHIISNHVHQVNNILGIDAAAATLFRELHLLLSFEGTYVDARHIMLIVDCICYSGQLAPMSRDGIKLTETSPLLLASFEKTLDNLLQACLHASTDTLSGVSENIMIGRQIPVGTGCLSVMECEEVVRRDLEHNPKVIRNERNMYFPGVSYSLKNLSNPDDLVITTKPLSLQRHQKTQREIRYPRYSQGLIQGPAETDPRLLNQMMQNWDQHRPERHLREEYLNSLQDPEEVLYHKERKAVEEFVPLTP